MSRISATSPPAPASYEQVVDRYDHRCSRGGANWTLPEEEPKHDCDRVPSAQHLRTGLPRGHDQNMSLRHADRALVPARWTMTLVRDERGRPSGALGLAIPIAVRDEPLQAARASGLTTVQSTVLERLVAGRGIGDIATELHLTRRGVDRHMPQLRRKLRASGSEGVPATTAELVARLR